jgi:phage-related minor tail protein
MTTSFTDPFHQAGAAAAPFQTQDLASTKSLLDQIAASGAKAATTLSNGFQNASASGRTLNGVLLNVAQSLAKTAATTGAQLLAQGLSSGVNAAISSILNPSGGAAANIAPFAEGGVVASPTFFGSGDSVGLMGERGAEAILPLARGPNGALGIATQGSARPPVAVTVNIAAQDADSFRRSEAQITGALARAVARGQRNL